MSHSHLDNPPRHGTAAYNALKILKEKPGILRHDWQKLLWGRVDQLKFDRDILSKLQNSGCIERDGSCAWKLTEDGKSVLGKNRQDKPALLVSAPSPRRTAAAVLPVACKKNNWPEPPLVRDGGLQYIQYPSIAGNQVINYSTSLFKLL